MAITTTAFATTSGNLYGDLSTEDALTIQSKMLPVAKKNLTFARFAQKDTKGRNDGNVMRHRRYKKFPLNDTPLGEGVTPDFDQLESEVISTTIRQYGRYVPVTDLMELLGQDPYVSIITERQAQQAAEVIDLLCYKTFRNPANTIYAGGANSRITVDGIVNTTDLDAVIRHLEGNDAEKLTEMLAATPDVSTQPLRPSYVAICHPILRRDLEALTGFVPVEQYANSSQAMDFEIGSYKGVRFLVTTQAVSFDRSGDTSLGAGEDVSVTNTNKVVKKGNFAEVYPIVIFAKDAVGTATIGGMDSIVPKVVRPTPSGTDPLGQRGTVGYTFMHGQLILNEDWIITIETGVSDLTLATPTTGGVQTGTLYAANS
jgi:N4-gp56 family major capsid protein